MISAKEAKDQADLVPKEAVEDVTDHPCNNIIACYYYRLQVDPAIYFKVP